MNSIHRMPFGAEIREDGATRFRLWAPSARTVDLVLEREGRTIPMPKADDGWCGATSMAPQGTPYRYRINGDMLVPDPASRFNPEDVHRASVVVDPRAYQWRDAHWRLHHWRTPAAARRG